MGPCYLEKILSKDKGRKEETVRINYLYRPFGDEGSLQQVFVFSESESENQKTLLDMRRRN